ncbi:MAG: P-II family nitrogen regulator, partial [Candidatus Hydrogenedentes bacterium]|nr:P-II family nitrogen regulator [Candidatus Hydrogenedentota bacterium]
MKLIQAYIKSHKLTDVLLALQMVKGFNGMTTLPKRGIGWRVREADELFLSEGISNFEQGMKLEVLCEDENAGRIFDTIRTIADTDTPGDGLVFQIDVEGFARIETPAVGDGTGDAG